MLQAAAPPRRRNHAPNASANLGDDHPPYRARSTGSKEQRTVPVADPEPAVDPSRFGGDGGWADPPEHWIEAAEAAVRAVTSRPAATAPAAGPPGLPSSRKAY